MKKFIISFLMFSVILAPSMLYANTPPDADYTFTITQTGTDFEAVGFAATSPGVPITIAPSAMIQDVINAIDLGRETAVKKLIFNGGATAIDLSTQSAIFAQGVYVFEGKVTSNTVNGTIRLESNASLYVVSGEIAATGTGRAIFSETLGAINVSGGTVKSELGVAIYSASAGIITISEENDSNSTLITSGSILGTSSATVTLAAVAGITADRLVILGGKIENVDGNTSSCAISNLSTGTISISGGEVYCETAMAISQTGAGTINVSGGSIKGYFNAINNTSSGYINIYGGILEGNIRPAIYTTSARVVNISETNPEIPTYISSSATQPYGTLHVRNLMSQGGFNISGGLIENKANGLGHVIMLEISGTNTISGGIIKATGGFIIENRDDNNINITGGELIGLGNSRGINNNYRGNINISGGIIRTENNAAIYTMPTSMGMITISQANENIPTLITSNYSDIETGGTIILGRLGGSITLLNVKGGKVENTNGNAILIVGQPINANILGGTVVSENSGAAIYNHGNGVITIDEENENIPTLVTSNCSVNTLGTIFLANQGTTETARLVVNAGTIKNADNSTGSPGRAIYNASTGAVNMTGGLVEANTGYAIHNASTGAINVSGGTIKSETGRGIHNASTGVITISEANASKPTLIITGELGGLGVPANYGIYLAAAGTVRETRLFIKGGTIQNNCKYAIYGACVYNASIGKIEISGGNLLADFGYCVYNTTGGMDMSGGYLHCNGDGSPASVAVCMANPGALGILNITGGTIRCESGAAISVQGMSGTTVNVSQVDDNVPTIISTGFKAGGAFSVPAAIYLQTQMTAATLNVQGGTIISDGVDGAFQGACIRTRESSHVNIYDGTLIVEDGIAVDLDYSGNFNMYNGLIDARNGSMALLSRYGYIVNVRGGTIQSAQNTAIWFDVTTSSGRLNISQDNPNIPTLITSAVNASDNRGTIQLGCVICGTTPQLTMTNGVIENTGNGPTVNNVSNVSVNINGGTVSALDNSAFRWLGTGTLTISEVNENTLTLVTSASTNTERGTIHLNNGSTTLRINAGEIGNSSSETENVITNPPNATVIIAPPTISNESADINQEYDGTGTISATAHTRIRISSFWYQWYKDNIAVDNSNSSSLLVNTVPQSGTYVMGAKTVFYGYESLESFSNPIEVNITKAPGAVVDAPVFESSTYYTLTIYAVTPPDNGQIVEYAISESSNVNTIVSWQTAVTFTGLNQNTTYYIFARSQENDNYYAGPIQTSAAMATEALTYTITATAGVNGSIAPNGVTTVIHGATPTYVITPNPGYHITAIIVDGTPITYTVDPEVTASYNFTFNPVVTNRTISATFALNCYTMNPNNSIGLGATLTMNHVGCVPRGSNVTFTISATCHQYQVWVGGVSQGTFNEVLNDYVFTYSITNVTEKLPLIEVLTTGKQYTVTATPAPGIDPMGYISPAGTATVNCGDDREYLFHPELG
ncbi:MAG: hypothetical protein FWD09_08255, partial [Lentimicrobiaceae bacterium]|nr:hypothetical protein [Lentimicrobiaceae bacterium]